MASCIAIDYSGSTGGSDSYWGHVKTILDKQVYDTILFWDTTCKRTTPEIAYENIKNKSGHGCTDPACIIPYLSKGMKLTLITDGQVPISAVQNTDDAIKHYGINLSTAEVHILDNGGEVNFSVAAPFTRAVPHKVFHNHDILTEGDSSQKLDLQPYRDLDYFLANYAVLQKKVFMQNIGLNNATLRNELLELKRHLLQQTITTKPSNDLLHDLENKNYDMAVVKARAIEAEYTNGKSAPLLIEAEIMRMVTICSNCSNFNFDQIQSHRYEHADMAPVVEADQVETLDVTDDFECPILLDQDCPFLMLKKQAPILANYPGVDEILNCPLRLLLKPDLIEKVRAGLDHVIGAKAFRALQCSPFTRAEIGGVITLAQHRDHVKLTNWGLTRFFFGSKLVGNSALWLIVLWRIAKTTNYLNQQPEFMKIFDSYIRYRLTTQTTSISLSGLPQFPMTKVPVAAALWYVLASGDFFLERPSQDRLRANLDLFEIIADIVRFLDYPCPDLTKRVAVLRAYSYLRHQDQKDVKRRLRATYQRHLQIGDRLIFLDGACQTPIFEPNFNLHHSELLAIFDLIQLTVKVSEQVIPREIVPKICAAVTNYTYPENIPVGNTRLCPRTLRPWSIDQATNQEWYKCAEITYGPLSGQISLYNYYIRYVSEKFQYPTKDEFMMYVADREEAKEFPRDTLPAHIEVFIDEVFSDYKSVGVPDNISVKSFIDIVNNSRDKDKRRQLELCGVHEFKRL